MTHTKCLKSTRAIAWPILFIGCLLKGNVALLRFKKAGLKTPKAQVLCKNLLEFSLKNINRQKELRLKAENRDVKKQKKV